MLLNILHADMSLQVLAGYLLWAPGAPGTQRLLNNCPLEPSRGDPDWTWVTHTPTDLSGAPGGHTDSRAALGPQGSGRVRMGKGKREGLHLGLCGAKMALV